MQTIRRQLESKKKAADQEGACWPDEHIAFELRNQPAPRDKTEWRSGNGVFPTELGIIVVRARKHEEIRERRGRRIGDVRRGPTQLLKVARAVAGFNLLELSDATVRSHHLDPAVVRSGGDAIHFVERVVAVLLVPEVAGVRIETQAKTIADAV